MKGRGEWLALRRAKARYISNPPLTIMVCDAYRFTSAVISAWCAGCCEGSPSPSAGRGGALPTSSSEEAAGRIPAARDRQ